MSRITGTVPITGTLSKVDTNDTYPLISNQDIKGGYKVVKSITERDNIPQSFLEEGLIVYIENTNQEFLWTNNAWKEIFRGNRGGNTISNEPNNAIEQKPDGFYVPKITGVNISADEGNRLENRADGLYVAQNELEKIDLSQYVRKDENGINGQDGQDGEDGATFTPIMTQVDENTINLSWSNNKNLANPQVFNVKGEKGDPGDTPSLKTINGESLIGDGDIIIQSSIDINPLQTELAEVKANNATLNSRLDLLANNMVDLFNIFLINTNQGTLDEFVRWKSIIIPNESNVFGGSSSASENVISFNNQKSAFIAQEDVIGIKFKLRAPNNPGGYILWLIVSVNSSDQSDVRALTVDFQTYIQETYTSWIKPREGHTAYDGRHGATAQNIKDVFNVHNVEITVIVEDGKIKCSNALGFKFEINAFAGSGFVTRLGLGSQANFSNNVQAYDIKILRSSEAS